MDTVCDLDHDDARVLCHRGNELAVGFRFLRSLVLFLCCGNLGDGIHHERRVFAKFLCDFSKRMLRVFDHVVEQACQYGGLVLLELGEYLCDFERVLGIGHAALAVLPVVSVCNKGDRFPKDPTVKVRVLLNEHVDNVLLIRCQVHCYHSP